MSTTAKIQRAMSELLKRSASMEPAEVVAVDKSAKTITVKTIEGIEIPDVRLRSIIKTSDAVVLYPKTKTVVLISPIGDEKAGNFKVVAVEEVEAVEAKIGDITLDYDAEGIKLNGDALGGLVNAQELKTQLDKNTTALDKVIKLLTTWVPVANDGGGKLSIEAKAKLIGVPLADLDNIENKKVKHG